MNPKDFDKAKNLLPKDFDRATTHLAKGIAKEEDERILEMMNDYARLEQAKLSVDTVICGICGNVLSSSENTKPCEHLIKLTEGL